MANSVGVVEKITTVCELYAPLFDPSVHEITEGSGRCTAKTTSNEIAAISFMLQSRFNNIWYCRAEQGDIRTKIFSSMISTIQRMGVEDLFTWSLSPLRIRCRTTGAVCYFSGINGKTDDDLTATKGFTPETGTLAMAILDEADEVKHPNHITAWKTTAARFFLPHYKIVYAYNPPINRGHWAHSFFADKIRNGAVEIYATWEDIRDQLSEHQIADILKFKRDDPEYYRYWYLGEPVSFKGMVYPQFKRETHCINLFAWLQKNPRDFYSELILGLDEGTVNDSTCVTALLVMASGRAIVMDCLEIDPLVIGQLSPAQTSRRLSEFLRSLMQRYPFLQNIPRRWIFECAEGGQMLRLQFVQDSGENTCLVTEKSIMGDVKRVRSMLSEGILFFHTDATNNTMQLVKDIENYVFDEKTGSIKKGQRDDTIDSLEYATKLYYNAPLA